MSVRVEKGQSSSRVCLVQQHKNEVGQTKTSGHTEVVTSTTGGPTVLVVTTGTNDTSNASQAQSDEAELSLLQTPGEERTYRRLAVLREATVTTADIESGENTLDQNTKPVVVVSKSGRQSTMTNHSHALSNTSSDAVSYVIPHHDDGTEYREMNENTLKLYYGERTPYGTVTRSEHSRRMGSASDVTSVRSVQSGDVIPDVTYQQSTSASIYSTLLRNTDKGPMKIPLRSNDIFYKDFLPEKIPKSTCFRGYKPFKECVSCANVWLEENRNVTLIRCESVRHRLDHSHEINPESTTSNDRSYLIGLRLWLRHLVAGRDTSTTIGYKNFIPRYANHEENPKYKPHECPFFEDLPTTLEYVNADMQKTPLPGSILNVEVVPINFSLVNRGSDGLDVEQSYYCLDFMGNWQFFCLRVFYICEKRTSVNMRLGFEDFSPSPLTLPPSKTQFQRMPNVMSRVNRWVQGQRRKDIVGVQALEIPFKPKLLVATKGTIKSHVMCYEPSRISVYWHTVRVIRVWYLTSTTDKKRAGIDQTVIPQHIKPEMAVRTFVPCQLTESGCCGVQKPIHATTRDTVLRISEWLQKTGVDLVYIETDNVEKWSSSSENTSTDLGERTYNKEDYKPTITKSALEYRLTVFRVYYRPNELTKDEEPDLPVPVKPICCFVGCAIL